MTIDLKRLLLVISCVVLAVGSAGWAQQPASVPASRPSPAATKRFVVEAEMPYRASLRATGIFINAFHLSKPTKEVIEAVKAQPKPSQVTVIICRGAQEQAIKDYWDVCDQYILEALFLLPEWSPPPSDTLLWPGVDHPMINYVRKIRMATQGKPVIVSVPMTCREVWGMPRERPELFEELKWMTMAVIGANYQGILWGHVRREPEWNEMLQELTDQIKAHATDLAAATPVAWVKALPGQPVAALASENKLFITLLNMDFMKLTEGKKRISGALSPGRCQGDLILNLPKGVTAGAATTLEGLPSKLTASKEGLACHYDFGSGGEMIIVSISRSSTTQPLHAGKP